MHTVKILIINAVCFISCMAFAQSKQDSLIVDSAYLAELKGQMYNPGYNCCPEFIPVPGKPVPDYHPNAKFINDTSLWEWRTVKLADFWEEKVYDLKPQYKDTLVRNDGSVIEVPIWIKYPSWRKGE